MYPMGPVNKTPTQLVISIRYCYDPNTTPNVVNTQCFGCSLEPVDLQQELKIASSGGQIRCLIAQFGSDNSLRWPESGNLRIFRSKRVMIVPICTMLVHSLASPRCVAWLTEASIWKGMYASLFDDTMNVNAIKALISYWNLPTHTILTRTGEMGIFLLEIAEIGGMHVWEEIYNEHKSQGGYLAIALRHTIRSTLVHHTFP